MIKLSIIIPFLNEEEEVENTIKNILQYSKKEEVELIVINDASDDNYNYDILATLYPIRYIKNRNRLGVAVSRDLGVALSTTPYFLLLDAHMRFYDYDWVDIIVNTLEENPQYFLCCQTKELKKYNNTIHENKTPNEPFGAYIDLLNLFDSFSTKWIMNQKEVFKEDTLIDIPCVLGAAYACSKKYWQYLKGLEGLLYYGYDETYISMKVWLSGGRCKLLRDVVIGHIYRDAFPYQTDKYYLWYNRLLLNSLLVPKEQQTYFLSAMRIGDPFAKAYKLFLENKEKIMQLRSYYDYIFIEDFSFFEELNERLGCLSKEIENEEEFLKELAPFLLLKCQSNANIGLFHGQMGIVIFLYHYARYIGCKVYEELAGELLSSICTSLGINMSYFLQSGLSGIGWGIEYLHQNNFIDIDVDDFLEVIDDKINEINVLQIKDLSINNGLGGIVHYVVARLYNKSILSQSIFEQKYLHSLYKRLKVIVNGEDITDAIEVFVKYIKLYEQQIINNSPLSIYDITFLRIPEGYDKNKSSLGIRDGSAGVGLMLILKEQNNN